MTFVWVNFCMMRASSKIALFVFILLSKLILALKSEQSFAFYTFSEMITN